MSKYTKEEQTDIVQLAMELQNAIDYETQELEKLSLMKFKSEPVAPTEKQQEPLKKVVPQYPETPKTDYRLEDFLEDSGQNASFAIKFVRFFKRTKHPVLTYCGIALGLMILGLIFNGIFGGAGIVLFEVGGIMLFPGWLFAAYFASQVNKEFEKAREIKQTVLEQSPEYLAARAEAERAADSENRRLEEAYRLQGEANRRAYEQSMDQYKTVTLVKYRNELERWQYLQAQKIKLLSVDLAENRQTQETLYSETQLIPKTIRSLKDLTYLYNDMSSSEHDIERAIDMLNAYNLRQVVSEEAEKTRQRLDARIYELRCDIQQGFVRTCNLIDEGNQLLSDLTGQFTEVMNGVRKQIIIGNFIGGVQLLHTLKKG